MDAGHAAGHGPLLRLEEFFAGRTTGSGVFQDRFGVPRRQFEIEVVGAWDGRTLTLIEDFSYDDGQTEQRTWRIEKVGKSGYEGKANGVIGTASGAVHGNVLHWTYAFALDVGARTWTVRFDDRLLLQRDGILLNRAKVTKLGLRLGEVTCVFRKAPMSIEPRRELAEATVV